MKTKLFAALVLTLVMVIPAFAAYDMYLAIAGVAGSLSDTAHKGWIPVTGIVDNSLKSGGTVGLVITKPADANSATLYKDCMTGRHHPSAFLDICKDGVLINRLGLQDITVSQLKPQFSKSDTAPQEELTFNFSEITWEFYTTDAGGKTVTTRTGWNNVAKKSI